MLSGGQAALLCAIVAVAFGLRLGWVLTVHPTPGAALVDSVWYYATASNLAHGYGFTVTALPGAGYVPGPGGYETTFWPPGYSLTLAGVFTLFGSSVTVARAVNVVAGAVVAIVTFLIGARLFGTRTGLTASALFAVYPASIYWSTVMLSEAVFTVPFAVAVLLLIITARRPSMWIALSFGLVLGYATIIRPQGASIWIAAVIYWCILRGPRRTLRLAPVAAVGLLLWVAPVSVWNSVRTGEPQGVSTNGAFNLRVGHSPDATGGYVHPSDPRDLLVLTSPEYTEQRRNLHDALSYAATHPLRELQLAGWKTIYLYTIDSDWAQWAGPKQPIWGSVTMTQHLIDIGDAANVMMLLLALASIPWTFSMRDERLALWLVLAAWTAVHIIFFSAPRYHLPLLPVLLTMAARTLVELPRLISGRATAPAHAADP